VNVSENPTENRTLLRERIPPHSVPQAEQPVIELAHVLITPTGGDEIDRSSVPNCSTLVPPLLDGCSAFAE
jgi:hypothetical protein